MERLEVASNKSAHGQCHRCLGNALFSVSAACNQSIKPEVGVTIACG